MFKHYRLNDNNDVEECDMFQAEEFLLSKRKIIKQENIGDKWVSTVFLSLDHSYPLLHSYSNDYKPIVFETMVKDAVTKEWEDFQERYRTYDEALAGHNAVVEKLKQGLPIDAE